MLRTYPPELGYDFADHWAYVQWMAQHWSIPPLADFRLANHPPLFYAIAAALVRLGGGPHAAQLVSVVSGTVRLVVLWIGLAAILPGARLARCTALTLAAALPVAVQIDGTVSGESLCATLVAMALVLSFPAFVSEGRPGVVAGLGVGTFLGLGLVTKISTMTVIATLGLVAVARVAVNRDDWRARARRLAPWGAALLMLLGTAGWYVVHNERAYGKPLVSGFDAPGLRFMPATNMIPLAFRRPPEFFFGWDDAIYRMPFYPSASLDHGRFLPQLIASTFVDYYNHSFAPARSGAAVVTINERPLPQSVIPLARASMVAGTVIVLLTTVSLVVLAVRGWRDRAWDRIAVLLVPVTGFVGQAFYALAFPHDWLGVVKGAYLLYAATPLIVTFGVGVEWLAARPVTRPVAVAMLVALGVMTAYTVVCRTL